MAPDRGMHVDQKWMDLAPESFRRRIHHERARIQRRLLESPQPQSLNFKMVEQESMVSRAIFFISADLTL